MFPQFHGLLGNRGHVLAKGVQKGHEVQVPCQVLVGVGRMRSPAVLWWNRDVLKSNGFAVLEAKQQPSGLSCARFSCVKTTWACSSLRLRVGIFSSENRFNNPECSFAQVLYGLVDTGICVKSLGNGLPVKKLKSIQGAVTGMWSMVCDIQTFLPSIVSASPPWPNLFWVPPLEGEMEKIGETWAL